LSFTRDKTYYLSLLTRSKMQVSDVTFTWVSVNNNPPELESQEAEKKSYSLYLIIAAAAALLAVATILSVWITSYYYRKKAAQKSLEHKNPDNDQDEVENDKYEQPSVPTAKLSLEKLHDGMPIKDEIQLDVTSVVSEITFGTHWHKPPIRKIKPPLPAPPVIDESNNSQTTEKTEKQYNNEAEKKSDLVSVCSYNYSLPGGIEPSAYGCYSSKVPPLKNIAEKTATISAVDDEDQFISTYNDDYP